MKLKLSQKGNLSILEILEEVDKTHAPVLSAGIKKLLQSGKNRIALNLLQVAKIPIDVLQQLIQLNMAATELGGSIALVGQSELVRQAIQSFSRPPAVQYFATLDEAINYLTPPRAEEIKTPAPAPSAKELTPAASAPKAAAASDDPLSGFDPEKQELKALVKKLEEENRILKGKAANANPAENKKIKAENGELVKQIRILEEEVRILNKERKMPHDSDGMKTRISQLEHTLADFLQKDGVGGDK